MTTIREKLFDVNDGIIQAGVEDFIAGDISWDDLYEIINNASPTSSQTTDPIKDKIKAYDRAMRGI